MKSHAPKLLRSTSKARAWYGFALLLGIGILLLPNFAKANLTSPVPVVTGSLYGQADSLGLRHSSNLVNDQDGLAWEFEQTQHRKLVYVTPQTGKELLVAAVLNKTGQGTCVDSEMYQTCRLEFRMSSNSGTTWSQALVGPTPYLSILGIKGSGGTKFDYALYVSPSSYGSLFSQDIWVSYSYATAVEDGRVLLRSKIQKLVYNNALGWTLGKASEPQIPSPQCDGVMYVDCFGETGVGVQIMPNGTERVWALASMYCTSYADCGTIFKAFRVVYSDNFSSGSPATWALSDSYGFLSHFSNTRQFGSIPRATFIPVGNKKIPTLVTESPLQIFNCTVINTSRALKFMTLKNETSTTWLNTDWDGNGYPVSYTYPFYYSFDNGEYNCPVGTSHQTLMDPYGSHPSSWAYPFSFSAAGVPDTTNTYKSRVVIAYSGGTDDASVDYTSLVRVSSCDVTINSGSGTSSITCPVRTLGILAGYTSPSVGYYKGKFWISAREPAGGGTKRLKIFSEQNYSPPTWTWAEETGNTFLNNIASPSAVDYIPSSSLISTNSNYIPTIFSDLSSNRIAFDANSGGASIGSNPKYSSNPIQGYGWASNFGWLSLNCINKPDQNCTNLFGLGIGSLAAASTTDLPPVTGLSPTSTTTFPLGGYAWSSNAGFLSLERRDSICGNATSCPGGVFNVSGSPPGFAYSNYTVSGTTATVTITTATQLNITTGDCTTFPVGKSIAVGIDYSIVKSCGAGIVDISGAPLTKYTIFPVAGVRVFVVDPNVPIAKYDTASQHVYGWGRFLNLCNYDSVNNRCLDKYAGWVRLRGFYKSGAETIIISNTPDAYHFVWDPDFQNSPCTSYVGHILDVGTTYVRIASCTGFNTANLDLLTPIPLGTASALDVTGKEYGLDAFWTGDHYEVAGWAWSNDYGWIRFNPLIFIGFSWMETLFGNVYSGGDITLPNSENLSHDRLNTCDTNGDGVFNEPCYVSTYRIEAGGSISSITYAGTGDSPYPAGSAAGSISAGTGVCGTGTNEVYCKLQGNTGELTALNSILARDSVTGPSFPTVGSTTTSYRNALGKLDVGGLTTIIGQVNAYTNVLTNSRGFVTKPNRFGNTVYKTSLNGASPQDWTINELSGWINQNWPVGNNPVLPLNVTSADTFVAPLRSQVVHVQGNLTVDGAYAVFGSYTAPTLTVTGVSGTFPTQYTINSSTVSCLGCAFVVDPGGANEEYFAYTSYAGGTFSGVTRIVTGCGTGCTHTASEKVRWVWRLPYADNGTANIAQRVTIVVDGDLNIQYNIIAANPVSDPDLPHNANTIRDLPTIAFVVKGNVIIDPQVNKVTGAFIVTSRDTSAGHEPNTPSCASIFGTDCGGAFSTGNDNNAAICNSGTKVCRPLTITGLLFARLFNFQRIGNLQKNDTPGERVVADERLFLNPPPGLEDVTKALPNPTRTLP